MPSPQLRKGLGPRRARASTAAKLELPRILEPAEGSFRRRYLHDYEFATPAFDDYLAGSQPGLYTFVRFALRNVLGPWADRPDAYGSRWCDSKATRSCQGWRTKFMVDPMRLREKA